MSISISHHAIFTAFGHRSPAAPRAHTSSKQARSLVPAEAAVPFEGGELKCSPWEGLYLEQARPFTANGNDAAAGRPLDDFLTSLMYGE
ncbi:MAG: hypothetical protein ACXVYB_16160 [Arthrobacter sp.]